MRSEIIAVRGRSIGDWYNSLHEQRIELRGQKSSSLTSVAKDNLLFDLKCMKKISQLNGSTEWGNTAHQQHRFYSIFGGGYLPFNW